MIIKKQFTNIFITIIKKQLVPRNLLIPLQIPNPPLPILKRHLLLKRLAGNLIIASYIKS